MGDKKIQCVYCQQDFSRRDISRIKKEWICKECHLKKRQEHREFLRREVCHINKRSPNGVHKEPIILPKLNIVKEKRKSFSTAKFNYFTMVERQILFKKYLSQGLEKEEINNIIKRDTQYLSDFIKNLRQQQTPEEDLNVKFKEEFAKLISGGVNG